MMPRSLLIHAALVTIVVIGSGDVSAQSRVPTISIGRIASEKNCTLYQESAGRSAVLATPYAIAGVESWRTWLVRDCVNNFASIRTSLQAALAASGKLAVRSGGGKYVLSGAISQVGGDDTPATQSTSSSGYSVSSQQIFVSMEVTLRDDSGRIVYGGLLTKHLEVGSNIRTAGLETSSSQSGDAVYTELQNQVALAVARLVAFHIVPLQVMGNDGARIQLNYGSPLLAMGTIVSATSPDGAVAMRYNVVSADTNGATAEKDGDGDAARIVPGSQATVIEADDPAANARRYQRVDLP